MEAGYLRSLFGSMDVFAGTDCSKVHLCFIGEGATMVAVHCFCAATELRLPAAGKLDSIRAKFFWQGAEDKFKYHMMKWEAVCRPKEFGGLGIINTRILNECLLVKWIWKIIRSSSETWCQILRAKYMPDGLFFNSKKRGSSQFWQGLHRVKHFLKWGVHYKVHSGTKVTFWKDTWLGESPIHVQFPNLFRLCEDPDILIVDCVSSGNWNLRFRRSLNLSEQKNLEILYENLNKVVLNGEEDEVLWALDNSRKFSTRSLYRYLTFGGVISRGADMVWSSKLPVKIKIFFGKFYTTDYKLLRF